MKKFIFLMLGFFIWQSALSQGALSTSTERSRSLYKNYTAATTGDTLVAPSTSTSSTRKYLDRIVFNTVVASDSVIVKNGLGTIATIIFTASPPVLPFSVDYGGMRVDTSLIIIKKKASDITVIWRAGL